MKTLCSLGDTGPWPHTVMLPIHSCLHTGPEYTGQHRGGSPIKRWKN